MMLVIVVEQFFLYVLLKLLATKSLAHHTFLQLFPVTFLKQEINLFPNKHDIRITKIVY